MVDIHRPVFFSGENPGMTLYVPGMEQTAAVASYWHCTDSPFGVGYALVLWLAEEADTIGHGAILTDNLDLAKVLVEKLTQHFPEFEVVPILALPYVMDAQCGHCYDGSRYQVVCQTPDLRVEIAWEEVLDRKQVVWPGFPAGEAKFDLTTVICPCRAGRVAVNGSSIEGEVKTAQGADGRFSSSAFLAFAESWIGPLVEE